MTRLVIATTNRDKIAEIREMLAGVPMDLAALADYPPIDVPEETGLTFAENARAKALHYAHAIGAHAIGVGASGGRSIAPQANGDTAARADDGRVLTVAEDSGLEIDALGGRPGVESARFGGVDSSYPDKFALIYDALRATPPGGRTARFVCALAVVRDGRVVFEARGTVEGLIAPVPAGDGGFGYDPIFYYPPLGCTLAQAGPAKATVSHRGEAFRKLREFLLSDRA